MRHAVKKLLAFAVLSFGSTAAAQTPPPTLALQGGWQLAGPSSSPSSFQWISVPGGYLIRTLSADGEHVVFVPDAAHDWKPLGAGSPAPGTFDGLFLHLTAPNGNPPMNGSMGDYIIAVSSLEYLEASGSGSIVHLKSGEKITVKEAPSTIWHALGN